MHLPLRFYFATKSFAMLNPLGTLPNQIANLQDFDTIAKYVLAL